MTGGPGTAAPLGAHVRDGGVNFSVYAKHDTSLPSPEDIHPWADAPGAGPSSYLVRPRSITVLAMSVE
jgi:hypothetical protein